MRKTGKLLMALLIGLVSGSYGGLYPEAQAETGSEAYVVYHYDFEDGTLPPGWGSGGANNSVWGVTSDPDDPANHVFARLSPAPDPQLGDARTYLYVWGKESWSDYRLEAESRAVALREEQYNAFGIAGRANEQLTGAQAARLLVVARMAAGNTAYQALNGASAFYAGSPEQLDMEAWHRQEASFEGNENRYAANGKEVLGSTANAGKVDDAAQPSSQLAAQGAVGMAEKSAWAIYDNVTLRVKETIVGIDAAAAEPGVSLQQPLTPGQFVALTPLAEIAAPFDGVAMRPIDTSRSPVLWSSSDPASIAVTDEGELVALAPNRSAVITMTLADDPSLTHSFTVASGEGDTVRPLRGIEIDDVGVAVTDATVRMFPWDRLNLERLVKVRARFYDGTEDVSAVVEFLPDAADGSASKVEIANGVLTLTDDAEPEDTITVHVRYPYAGQQYSAPLHIAVKEPVPIDAFSFAPFHGFVYEGGTLDLDAAAIVATGSRTHQFDDITGFVDWEIKIGQHLATLSQGSRLTVHPNASPRDVIVMKASYTVEGDDGPRTLTNEFNVEVAGVHQTVSGAVYDILYTNGPSSPLYTLEGIQIERGAAVVETIPLLKWQTLALDRDIRVRGVYDNPRGETDLTAQATWSIHDDPLQLAELAEVGSSTVLRFTDSGAASAEGTVVLKASYGGQETFLTIIAVQADGLEITPAVSMLLPGETLDLAHQTRAALTGAYGGQTYRFPASDHVTWAVAAGDAAKIEVSGDWAVPLAAFGSGEEASLVATYADGTFSASAAMDIRRAEKVNVNVDTAAPHPYNRSIMGFNDGRFGYNATRYTDEDIQALVEPLHPGTLRFAAGHFGSYYRWEVEGYIPETLHYGNNAPWTWDAYDIMRRDPATFGRVPIEEFLQYSEEVGAEPVIQLNVYSADVESAVGLLRYVKSLGYDVKYWELDNELYHDAGKAPEYSFRVGFPTVDEYVRKAKEFALALKAEDPDIQLIVLGGWHKSVNGLGPDNTFNKNWADTVAQENFYDLVQEHWYLHGALQPSAPYAEQVRTAFMHPQHAVKLLAEDTALRFPGKKLALTEWGIEQPAGNLLINTLAQVLYDADVLLEMIEYDNIGIANRFSLVGNGYEAIGFTGNPWDNSHEPTRRATYYGFQLLGELFAAADSQVTASHNDAKFLAPAALEQALVPTFKTAAFQDSVHGKLYLAVVNKDGSDKPLELTVDQQPYAGPAKMRFVTGPRIVGSEGSDIYTLMNNNGGLRNVGSEFVAPIPTDTTQYVELEEITFAAGAPIVVPGYSVAVIEWPASP